jgi:DNA-binding protein
MADKDGVVFIGSKPPMNYVLAVVTQFHGGSEVVHIKARGRAISRAVDVAEIVRNRFIEDVKPTGIEISTEVIKGENNENINVSAIDIELSK